MLKLNWWNVEIEIHIDADTEEIDADTEEIVFLNKCLNGMFQLKGINF